MASTSDFLSENKGSIPLRSAILFFTEMAEWAYASDLESGFWGFESLSPYNTYLKITLLAQLAEAKDLKFLQSGFESQVGYKDDEVNKNGVSSLYGKTPHCG